MTVGPRPQEGRARVGVERAKARPLATGVLVVAGVLGAVALLVWSLQGSSSPGSAPPSDPVPTARSAALARIDGSYVLAGANPYDEKLYRVADGRLRQVGAAANFDGATSVTAHGDTVVLGFEDSDGTPTIRQVRDGRLVGLGITTGFSPALSGNGSLAWASSGAVADAGAVGIFVRDPSGRTRRTVAMIPNPAVDGQPVLGVEWVGVDLIVGVVRNGVISALRYENARGPAEIVATLDVTPAGVDTSGQVAGFAAGGRTVVLTTESGNVVVPLDGGGRGSFSTDEDAVCVTGDDDILTVLDGKLTLVAAGSGGAGRSAGRLPSSLSLFDATCSG